MARLLMLVSLVLAAAATVAAEAPVVGSKNPVYLMEIEVLPCVRPNRVVSDVRRVIRNIGDDSSITTNITWLLKYVGENKVLSVVENDPEILMEALNERLGQFIKVTCTPLRPYENFAHSINKVEAELCGPAPNNLSPGGHLYYIQAVVHYEGLTIDELLEIWPKESRTMLQKRKDGKVEMEFWKMVGTNTIHVLFNSDMDTLDDMSFTVPMVKLLGDNVSYPTKEVRFF